MKKVIVRLSALVVTGLLLLLLFSTFIKPSFAQVDISGLFGTMPNDLSIDNFGANSNSGVSDWIKNQEAIIALLQDQTAKPLGGLTEFLTIVQKEPNIPESLEGATITAGNFLNGQAAYMVGLPAGHNGFDSLFGDGTSAGSDTLYFNHAMQLIYREVSNLMVPSQLDIEKYMSDGTFEMTPEKTLNLDFAYSYDGNIMTETKTSTYSYKENDEDRFEKSVQIIKQELGTDGKYKNIEIKSDTWTWKGTLAGNEDPKGENVINNVKVTETYDADGKNVISQITVTITPPTTENVSGTVQQENITATYNADGSTTIKSDTWLWEGIEAGSESLTDKKVIGKQEVTTTYDNEGNPVSQVTTVIYGPAVAVEGRKDGDKKESTASYTYNEDGSASLVINWNSNYDNSEFYPDSTLKVRSGSKTIEFDTQGQPISITQKEFQGENQTEELMTVIQNDYQVDKESFNAIEVSGSIDEKDFDYRLSGLASATSVDNITVNGTIYPSQTITDLATAINVGLLDGETLLPDKDLLGIPSAASVQTQTSTGETTPPVQADQQQAQVQTAEPTTLSADVSRFLKILNPTLVMIGVDPLTAEGIKGSLTSGKLKIEKAQIDAAGAQKDVVIITVKDYSGQEEKIYIEAATGNLLVEETAGGKIYYQWSDDGLKATISGYDGKITGEAKFTLAVDSTTRTFQELHLKGSSQTVDLYPNKKIEYFESSGATLKITTTINPATGKATDRVIEQAQGELKASATETIVGNGDFLRPVAGGEYLVKIEGTRISNGQIVKVGDGEKGEIESTVLRIYPYDNAKIVENAEKYAKDNELFKDATSGNVDNSKVQEFVNAVKSGDDQTAISYLIKLITEAYPNGDEQSIKDYATSSYTKSVLGGIPRGTYTDCYKATDTQIEANVLSFAENALGITDTNEAQKFLQAFQAGKDQTITYLATHIQNNPSIIGVESIDPQSANTVAIQEYYGIYNQIVYSDKQITYNASNTMIRSNAVSQGTQQAARVQYVGISSGGGGKSGEGGSSRSDYYSKLAGDFEKSGQIDLANYCKLMSDFWAARELCEQYHISTEVTAEELDKLVARRKIPQGVANSLKSLLAAGYKNFKMTSSPSEDDVNLSDKYYEAITTELAKIGWGDAYEIQAVMANLKRYRTPGDLLGQYYSLRHLLVRAGYSAEEAAAWMANLGITAPQVATTSTAAAPAAATSTGGATQQTGTTQQASTATADAAAAGITQETSTTPATKVYDGTQPWQDYSRDILQYDYDGDGVNDLNEISPFVHMAGGDSDGDGISDSQDQYPYDISKH